MPSNHAHQNNCSITSKSSIWTNSRLGLRYSLQSLIALWVLCFLKKWGPNRFLTETKSQRPLFEGYDVPANNLCAISCINRPNWYEITAWNAFPRWNHTFKGTPCPILPTQTYFLTSLSHLPFPASMCKHTESSDLHLRANLKTIGEGASIRGAARPYQISLPTLYKHHKRSGIPH